MTMRQVGDIARPPAPPDPDDIKYSLVMHGLCKRYGVKDPLEKHIFSIIENMSRNGGMCLYGVEKMIEYSGGAAPEIERALSNLQAKELIVRGKLRTTNGWKLSLEVRRQANWFKAKIDASRRGKSHN